MSVAVHHGCSRDVLATLDAASVDSVVCDPPYDLKFMGKKWDTGETAFDPAFWAEVLRVLKPGGHVVAFGGTRTYHRLVCAIEDAGFEIRDQLAWLYGSGFPKSHDVSKGIDKALGVERRVVAQGKPVKRMIPGADQHKGGWEKNNGREFVPSVTEAGSERAAAWEGWGTALKPALEPIVLARKPLAGTVAANVLTHGTGALNVDGCRVATSDADKAAINAKHAGMDPAVYQRPEGVSLQLSTNPMALIRANAHEQGRWPANVCHDGSAEVVEAFPEGRSAGDYPSDSRGTGAGTTYPPVKGQGQLYADSGSAARFFYSAKADAEDRLGSKHPTVKPVDLMAWLCRLVTPPGGMVLDPFAGTGTTGLAAMREGFDCILIEREAEYVADIERRLAWARGQGKLTAQEMRRGKQATDLGPLFAP